LHRALGAVSPVSGGTADAHDFVRHDQSSAAAIAVDVVFSATRATSRVAISTC
jgi:hypothetical protein